MPPRAYWLIFRYRPNGHDQPDYRGQRADDELPRVVYVTGSQAKLDQMNEYALVRDLRKRGTRVVLIDRKDPDIIEKLTEYGKSDGFGPITLLRKLTIKRRLSWQTAAT